MRGRTVTTTLYEWKNRNYNIVCVKEPQLQHCMHERTVTITLYAWKNLTMTLCAWKNRNYNIVCVEEPMTLYAWRNP
jgi:hypothetical protein